MMKKIGRIILICVGLIAMRQPAIGTGGDDVVMVAGKRKDLFMIKADRRLVGARVEVFYANGDVVTRQTLEKRKMIIDFSDVKPGAYLIRVSKEHRVTEFEYNKT